VTEVTLTYTDTNRKKEQIPCNYCKPKEGWLELALTTDAPHEKLFIPAHTLLSVRTRDIPDDRGDRDTRFVRREKGRD
jgi:hypothetical protein